jgi:hypothetical protein
MWTLLFFLASNPQAPINHQPYTQYATQADCEKDGKAVGIDLTSPGEDKWTFQCRPPK